jgi:hypothetical protein
VFYISLRSNYARLESVIDYVIVSFIVRVGFHLSGMSPLGLYGISGIEGFGSGRVALISSLYSLVMSSGGDMTAPREVESLEVSYQ